MFREEMFGYSKEDVDRYLNEILKRLEGFEHTIEVQREEIKSLEKRIEVLKTCDSSEEIVETARENADKIIFNTLLDINDLQERIQNAIERELKK